MDKPPKRFPQPWMSFFIPIPMVMVGAAAGNGITRFVHLLSGSTPAPADMLMGSVFGLILSGIGSVVFACYVFSEWDRR